MEFGFCCYFWYLVIVITLLVMIGLILSLPEVQCNVPAKTMVILGSGGHTKEILSLAEKLPTDIYSPRIYVYSGSDILSRTKAINMEETRSKTDYFTVKIFRSRHVGQSWITSTFTTLFSMIHAIYILTITRPNLILCNGPGVCVPICVIAYFGRKLRILTSRIIYVESICRLQTLSFSGIILRHFVDRFFVQWKKQADIYPGTEYIGRLA